MIHKERITDIFFDLDHTLWDFEKNSALTFELIFKELDLGLEVNDFLSHYTPINHACWKLYRENKISQIELRTQRLENTFGMLEYEISTDQIQEISELYINNLSTFPHLFDGTHQLLAALKKNYRLHIITNGFEMVQHFKISNSGLEPYFEYTFTAEKVGYKKPHPQIFHTALETVKTTPEASLMIGDSFEADIEGALQLGMQAVHFNSHHEAEHNQCPIVYSLKELSQMFN